MSAQNNNVLHDSNRDVMIVGKVTQLQGQAIAVSPDGHVRDLHVGDTIYLNDTINASSQGAGLQIKLVNGVPYSLTQGSSVTLNPDTIKQIVAHPVTTQEQQQTAFHGAFHITYQGKMSFVTSGFTTHACGYVNPIAGHAPIVGTVHCSEGFVTAVGANGETRILNAGDPIYAGDVVSSTLNSTASIQLDSGGMYNVSPDQSFTAGACSTYESEETSEFDSGADFTMLPIIIASSSVSSGFDTSGESSAPPAPPPPPPPPSQAEADLVVTEIHSPGNTVTPGSPDPIIVEVYNAGPDNVVGATVTASIPTGLIENISSPGYGANFSVNLVAGTVTWTGLTIDTGQTLDLQIVGTVDPNLREGTSTFNSTATATNPPGVTDPDPGNGTGSTVNNVQPEANLTIITTNTDAVVPGKLDTLDVTVTNNGPSNLTNITVVDTLPAGSALLNVVSLDLPSGVTFINLGNGVVEWTGINLASTTDNGTPLLLQLQGTVNPALPVGTDTFINTAVVNVQQGDTNINQSNNTTSTPAASNNVTPEANISVNTSIDGQSSAIVNIGQTVTYTITLGNSGPSDATNVQVQDILSSIPGVTFNLNTATVNEGTLSTGAGNLAWSLSDLGVTGVDQIVTPTLTITGTVTSVETTPIANDVTATANDSPSASSTATATVNADVGVSTTITGSDSSINSNSSSGSSITVGSGDTVTYQISAFNNGGITATGVVVTDVLPAGLTINLASINASIGSVAVNDGILTWTLPNTGLAPAANATLTYSETATSPASISVDSNTVSIVSTQTNANGDGTPGDNTSVGNVTVIPEANVSITNSDGVSTVTPGSSDTYSITITNNGSSAISNATVTDILPSALTDISSTSAGFTNLGTGEVDWTGISLGAGDSITLNLSGDLPSTLAAGSLVNIAQLTLPSGEINSNANTTAIDTNTITPSADLVIQTTDTSAVTNGAPSGTANATTGGVGIPGDVETFTVTISNLTGPSAITGATVTDLLPAVLTDATVTANGTGGAVVTSVNGSAGSIDDTVNIPVGGILTFTIEGTLSASATGTVVNTATITTPSGSTDTDSFTSSPDIITLQPQGNIAISSSDTAGGSDSATGTTINGTVTPGTMDTYSITLSNTGPSDLTNATVIDTLPAGLTAAELQSVTSSALPPGATFTNLENGTVEWTGVNLTSTTDGGAPVTLELSGLVDPTLASGTNIVNSATVSLPSGEENTNSANATTTITDTAAPQSYISVAITDSFDSSPGTFSSLTNSTLGGVVTAGSTEVYTIVISNTGTSTVTGLPIQDTFPISATGIDALNWSVAVTGGAEITSGGTSGSGNVSAIGTADINDTATLPAGSTITYTIDANVSTTATSPLSDTVTITPPTGDTNGFSSSTDSETIVSPPPPNSSNPDADISIQLTDNLGGTPNSATNDSTGGTGIPGDSVVYTLTVTNNGPTAVTGATVSDILPAGISTDLWSATLSGGATDDNPSSSGSINDTVNLPVGASIVYSIDAFISNSATATQINEATVTPPSNVNDTNQFTQSLDITSLTPTGDISISSSDSKGANSTTPVAGTVTPGESDTYTITLQNSGSSNITNATVIDTLPTGLETVTPGTLPNGVSFIDLGNGEIEFTGITLAAGSTTPIQLQFTGTVSPDLPGNAATPTFQNSATVSVPTGEENSNTNTTTTLSDYSVPLHEPSLTNTVDGTSSESVNLGQVVTYTIQFTNSGPSAESAVVADDLLPAGLTLLSYNTSPGTSYNSTTGNWTLGTVAAGATETLTLVAQVSSGSTTVITNEASTGGAFVPNTATSTVTVNPNINVSESINGGNNSATVAAGQTVTYTLTASNTGGNTTSTTTITDTLPANFTYDSYITPSVGTVTESSGILTWVIPTLDAGANATLTYTETADSPSAIESDTNNVTISNSNNSTTGNVTVVPEGSVAITNSDGVTSVVPGTSVTYTIDVTNSGPSIINNATVTDILPAGLISVLPGSLPAGASFSYNAVTGVATWTGLTLASGQTELTLSGTVDPTLQPGTFVSIAQLSLPAGEMNSNSINTATDSNTITPQSNVEIKVTDSGSLLGIGSFNELTNFTTGGISIPGIAQVYAVTVSNSGPSDVTGATVTDVLPAGLTNITSPGLPNGVSFSYNATTGVATWSGIDLVSGVPLTFALDGTILQTATGNLVNTATITLPNGDTDTNSFSSSTDTIQLQPEANLILTNSDGKTSVLAGSTETYDISLKNTGPSTVTGATIVDTLPVGLTNVTSPNLPSGVQFINLGNGQVEWVVLSIASGQTYSLQLAGTVNPDLNTSTITNTAVVSAPAGEVNTNAANNTVNDPNSVSPIADLTVLNLVDGLPKETVGAGAIVLYTVQVTDIGELAANTVKVSDLLPAGLTVISDTVSAGTYADGVWQISSLAALGGTATLTIEAQTTGVNVTSTATASAANVTGTVSSTVMLTDPPAGSNTQNTNTNTYTNSNNSNINNSHTHYGDDSNNVNNSVNNNSNFIHNSSYSPDSGWYQNIVNLNDNTIFTKDNEDKDPFHHHHGHDYNDLNGVNNSVLTGNIIHDINNNSNPPANCDAHKFDNVINGHDIINGFHNMVANFTNLHNGVDLNTLLNKIGGEELKSCPPQNEINSIQNANNDSNINTPASDPKCITHLSGYEMACGSALVLDPSMHSLGPDIHPEHIHMVHVA